MSGLRNSLWRLAPILLAASVLAAAPVTASTSADEAAPVTGLWLSSKKKVLVDIYPCENRYCGKIVWLAKPYRKSGEFKRDARNPDPSLRTRGWCGIEVLQGLKPKDGDHWKSGTFYYPKMGQTFDVDIEMKSDSAIEIRAYLGIPLLGKTEVWTRPEEGHVTGCVPEPPADES